MAGNKYVYEVAVDTTSLASSAATVRRTLGGAMANVPVAAPNLAPVTAAVSGVKAQIGGLSGMLGGMGVMLGVGAVAMAGTALVGFGKQAVLAASATSESLSKVRVVFRSSAADIETFASTATTALGMSTQKALEASGTLGNLFTAMGIGLPDATRMSKALLQLAADLASFNNIDPTLALEKLRAGLVGEAEPLRALGINLTEAGVTAQALAMGLAQTATALTVADKTAARYALIMQQSATAQGDFARTATGLANSSRIAAGELEDLKANLGKLVEKPFTVIVRVAATGVGSLNDALTDPGGSLANSSRTLGGTLSLNAARMQLGMAQAQVINFERQIDSAFKTQQLAFWRGAVADAEQQVAALTVVLGTVGVQLDNTPFAAWSDAGTQAALRVKAAMLDVGDVGLGVAVRMAAASAAAMPTTEHLGLSERTAAENALRLPAPKAQPGSRAWADAQVLDAAMLKQARAADKAASDMEKALIAGGKSVNASIESAFGQGSNFSKGLSDLTGGGPLAPGQGGAFEDIYRLQAWLADNSWGETASKFGFGEGDKGAVAAIIKDFQNQNYTPDVLKLIDQSKVGTPTAGGLTGLSAPTLLADVQAQFAAPEATAALQGVGSLMVKEIFAAWERDAGTTPWAGSLIAQIQVSLITYFEAQQKGKKQ
jgi:hypothetical protein